MLVRSKGNPNILWIVEVETAQAGKSVVGAAVLADVCMQIEIERGKQKGKPILIFVFYRASANLQLAEKRLRRLHDQRKIEHLGGIKILTKEKALIEIRSYD